MVERSLRLGILSLSAIRHWAPALSPLRQLAESDSRHVKYKLEKLLTPTSVSLNTCEHRRQYIINHISSIHLASSVNILNAFLLL